MYTRRPTFDELPDAIFELLQRMTALEQAVANSAAYANPADSEDVLLTVEDACEVLCVKKSTLYSLVSRRVIPSYKQGKRLFFKRQELVSGITSRKRASLEEINALAALHTSQRTKSAQSKKTRQQ